MKKINFIFQCLIVLYSPTNSQVNQEWVRFFNTPGFRIDLGVDGALDDNGNICVLGYTEVINSSPKDFVILKYNPSGVLLWSDTYNGTGNDIDEPIAIASDHLGNTYVTGNSIGLNSSYDIVLIKYNSSGIRQWVQRYNGPGNYLDGVSAMVIDNYNNVYLTGGSTVYAGSSETVTIKFNASANIEWIAKYNLYPSYSSDILVDLDGFVCITGQSYRNSNYDFVTIKYNFAGVQQWVRFYGTNSNDRAKFIDCDQARHTIVCGISDSGATIRTLKYDNLGNQTWLNILSNNYYYQLISFRVDGDGNSLILPGFISGYNAIVLKLNQNGNMVWYSTSQNVPQELEIDNSNNIYITGWTYGGAPSGLMALKYDTSGNQIWQVKYLRLSSSSGKCVMPDNVGNVYVVGQAIIRDHSNDILTIKYSNPIGINPISNEIPKAYKLYQNYPNPFNPVTKIRFDIPSLLRRGAGVVVLKIYDLLGREVATLVNEQLKPGTYEVEFDGNSFASGVYFYSLITSEFTQTKKLILLK